MIHTVWYNFRSWKVWAGGIVLIGLLFITTQCSPRQQTATPIVKVKPPEITGFTLNPSGPMFSGARIGIYVNVNRNDYNIDNYRWSVEAGEGRIVSGQGAPLITYEAPKTPGTYEVRVELEYEGGSPIKGLTKVEVLLEPIPTPTDTPTPAPTDTPSPNTPTPTPTATPTPTPTSTVMPTPKPDAVVNTDDLNLRSGPGTDYDILEVLKRGDSLKVRGKCPDGNWLKVACPSGQEGWVAAWLLQINLPLAEVALAQVPPTPTPAVTPTPELLPAPTLLEPQDGERDFTGSVDLKWQWIRDLKENEFYSLRVWRQGEPQVLCHHVQPKIPEYSGNLSSCRTGTVCWWVAVTRKVSEGPPPTPEWEDISQSSEVRCFSFHAIEPEPSGGGEEGGGEAPEPPW